MCLPHIVLEESTQVQAPGKGVNDAGSKSSKHMQGDVNKSSLECGSLGTVVIESTEYDTPENGDNNAGEKHWQFCKPLERAQGKGYRKIH